MFCRPASALIWALCLCVFLSLPGAVNAAEWEVKKSSGDVWIAGSGLQPVALGDAPTLRPGDKIQTGKTGRVLLVRGKESILIAPNSVISLPTQKKDGLSTTILQQAGSILLDVEKKNVKHFEVETPYLAAIVKGTHFRVSVDSNGAKVDVERGKVEVSDFKTGQFTLVLPGQHAQVPSLGNSGLRLFGSGQLNPIEQGKPRKATIERVPVPASGLKPPRAGGRGEQIQALSPRNDENANNARAGRTAVNTERTARAVNVGGPNARIQPTSNRGITRNNNVVRIGRAIGQVTLNVGQATRGLSRSRGPRVQAHARRSSETATYWNGKPQNNGSGAVANGPGNGNGGSNSSGGNGAAVSSVVAAATANANAAAHNASQAAMGAGSNNGNAFGLLNGNNGNNSNSGNSGNNGNAFGLLNGNNGNNGGGSNGNAFGLLNGNNGNGGGSGGGYNGNSNGQGSGGNNGNNGFGGNGGGGLGKLLGGLGLN